MFLVYCLLIFVLAGSLGVIVRCFVSVSREPSYSKLSAITAAVLLCLILLLISQQNGGAFGGLFQPLFRKL